MAHSQFDIFLQEATYRDQASDQALTRDRLYGLYVSWCFINQQAVSAEESFGPPSATASIRTAAAYA